MSNALTSEALLAAGFWPIYPIPPISTWDGGWQWRVYDEIGTRYFIEVHCWDNCKYTYTHIRWDTEVNFNDGAEWHPAAMMRVTAGDIGAWTPQDVLKWADQLWSRLAPKHYEKGE